MLNRIGPNRAIIERARRRGYAEVVAAIKGRAPKRIVGRLIDWQKIVGKWHKRVYANADETTEHESPPTPGFSERRESE